MIGDCWAPIGSIDWGGTHHCTLKYVSKFFEDYLVRRQSIFPSIANYVKLRARLMELFIAAALSQFFFKSAKVIKSEWIFLLQICKTHRLAEIVCPVWN